MLLSELFSGAPDLEVEQLSVDSRFPMQNAIFFCLNGIKYDGHNYIREAIENGAKVIVYSKDLSTEEKNRNKAIYIKVPNVNNALTEIGNRFYGDPNSGIDKYLVCGSYGKSSVTSHLNYFLNQVSSCAYVGILGINYEKTHLRSSFSTLNMLDNLKILTTIKKAGIKACTFEADVRSLNLQKMDTIVPDHFIYTCTNVDHSSDYLHNQYFVQLRRYLYTLEDTCKIIWNIDDISFRQIEDCIHNYVTYGFSNLATYQIRDVMMNRNGIDFKLKYKEELYHISCRLQGISSLYNLAATIVCLHQQGYEMEQLIEIFKEVPDVDGVMERVDEEYDIIVDSAYDLSSIAEICQYAKTIKHRNKAIGVISVNYSDGEKRLEKMMRICEESLDVIILTENESSEAAVSDILERCDKYLTGHKEFYATMRSLAIQDAVDLMNREDVLIIIGKGNEKFLEMGLGKEYYHGDKYYAMKYIRQRRREENETE